MVTAHPTVTHNQTYAYKPVKNVGESQDTESNPSAIHLPIECGMSVEFPVSPPSVDNTANSSFSCITGSLQHPELQVSCVTSNDSVYAVPNEVVGALVGAVVGATVVGA